MTGTNTATANTTTSKTTTNQKGVKNMSIKTTKKNHIFIIQKKVGSTWRTVTESFFTKRKFARECSNTLNNVAGVTGRGPNRRYRVAIMRVVSEPTQQ